MPVTVFNWPMKIMKFVYACDYLVARPDELCYFVPRALSVSFLRDQCAGQRASQSVRKCDVTARPAFSKGPQLYRLRLHRRTPTDHVRRNSLCDLVRVIRFRLQPTRLCRRAVSNCGIKTASAMDASAFGKCR